MTVEEMAKYTPEHVEIISRQREEVRRTRINFGRLAYLVGITGQEHDCQGEIQKKQQRPLQHHSPTSWLRVLYER